MIALGIDIGGSSVKLAAVQGGQTLWTGQSPFYTRPTTTQLIAAIQQAAGERAGGRIDVAGICVPGLLDRERRTITLSVNVPGLMGVVLDELVARALGPIVRRLEIVNDAVATATDVIRTRGLRGRVVSLALGTGVGMGVLDDGVPLFIEGASPGHIGQVDVSIENDVPLGPDGGAGSLEGYIGVPAIIRRYGSTEAFYQNAKVTDPPLRALARAIRICHAIYRPHHVVLVGGVGIRLRHLLPQLKQLIDTNLTSVARRDWTLSCGEHDFHAALGAARLAAEMGS
ncbi:ROK family protein [Fontivita pretiosa]|jgi:predicted NBD/HSP70 family sugar kinase|uniref:ROK family protein n=1 Tax=Fontivita pretiosa TaxID=2989684 RepID=UPI003D1830BB